jgi:hypothetical protein
MVEEAQGHMNSREADRRHDSGSGAEIRPGVGG